MSSQCCKQIATGISENPTQQLIKLNCLLRDLVHAARFCDALHLFRRIHSSHAGKQPDCYTLSTALTACAHLHDAASGAQLHALSIRSGLSSFPHVANSLLSLYAKSRDLDSVKLAFGDMERPDVYSHTTLLSACAKLGEVHHALQVFDEMPQTDLALWNAMITGCAESNRDGIAFRLFSRMRKLGITADHYTLTSLLSLCYMEIHDFGKQLHSLVLKTGYLQKASVVNSLLTMYFNCGSAADAYGVFKNISCDVGNEITHNAMIAGLINMEQHEEALMMFKDMLAVGLRPTELTFVSIMGVCFFPKLATQVHGQAAKRWFGETTSVNNAAISMYSNCGDLNAACLVFQRLEDKDVVSWNAIMASFVQENMSEDAVLAYLQMQRNGIQPDEFTVGSLLGAAEKLDFVEMIHAVVMKRALDLVEVSNALLSAFSRIGEIEKATNLFEEMHFKNMISWNVMISGFLLNGLPVRGLQEFSILREFGLQPNHYTLSLVLSFCASVSDLLHGKQIHAYVLKFGYFLHTLLGNSLITVYSKCGALNWSLRVFQNMVEKDTVSWNSLISAYSQNGEGEEAIQWFEAMRHSSTVEPDKATFTAVLSACSHSGLVAEGIRIFNLMVRDYGIEPEMHHFSCLVDLLGRAGFIDVAERLMEVRGVDIDPGVWWALFSSCAAHGNLQLGSIVAEYLLATEIDDPAVFVLLSNLYANAGKWEESANVRESIKKCGVMKEPGRSWITS